MTKISTHLTRAFSHIDLAGIYAADGALHTATRCLRDAADRMEKAAKCKDRQLRTLIGMAEIEERGQ